MKTINIIVSGRVQGVGFRYYTMNKAKELGVSGWVRNLHNGDVEILASSPPDEMDKFIEFVNSGPSFAHVVNLDFRETQDSVSDGFEIK